MAAQPKSRYTLLVGVGTVACGFVVMFFPLLAGTGIMTPIYGLGGLLLMCWGASCLLLVAGDWLSARRK